MEENTSNIARRGFIFKSLTALGVTVAAASLQPLYAGGINTLLSLVKPKQGRRIKLRKTWNYEGLVLNTKTNTIHYPTEKLFRYYDKISDKNIRIIQFTELDHELKTNRLHLNKSGIILEKLALLELSHEITPATLDKAINKLSLAFSPEYVKGNEHNWRVYDLLLLLLILNTAINDIEKREKFTSITSNVNFGSFKIPLRNNWVSDELAFTNKVNYLKKNIPDYTQRLKKRILQ